MKLKLFTIIFFAIAFSACEKKTISTSNWISDANLYIAGNARGSANNIYSVGAYWHGNQMVQLGSLDSHSLVNKIIPTPTMITMVGMSTFNGKGMATLWQNQGVVRLETFGEYSEATDMAIVNDVVYVCGFESTNGVRKAAYWTDGKINYLSSIQNESAFNAIVVANENIYLAGFEKNNTGNKDAKFWINGIESNVSNSGSDDEIYDLKVVDGYTFAAGRKGFSAASIPAIWVNGSLVSVNSTETGFVKALEVVKTANNEYDVYAVGGRYINNKGQATFWKNGEVQTLDKTLETSATDICLNNGNIFICGIAYGGLNYAVYWKNGIRFSSEGTATPRGDIANSIAVMP
jgi:hypothetical protein